MEIVQVENTHQQEGSGYENPGEQRGERKSLQAQVIQAADVEKIRGNRIT